MFPHHSPHVTVLKIATAAALKAADFSGVTGRRDSPGGCTQLEEEGRRGGGGGGGVQLVLGEFQ